MDESKFGRAEKPIMPDFKPGKPQLESASYQSVPATAAGPSLASSDKPNEDPYPWVLSPTIDMLFCCGGIFWIIFAVYKFSGVEPNLFGNPAAFTLMATAIIGLHIFGDAHQPATLFRVYGSAATRKSLGWITAVLGVMALGAGLCTFFLPWTAVFWVKLVLAWGYQHQLSQSYGIALLYCIKRKYRMTKNEKLIMAAMINCTILYLVLRMFSMQSYGTGKLFGAEIPFWNFVPAYITSYAGILLIASIAVFFGMIARKYVVDKVMFPLPGLLTLMTLVILPYFAGEAFFLVWMLFSQHFFHSSQYLVVTTAYYLKERGLPENTSFWEISKMLKTRTFAMYFGIIFSTGFFLAFLFPNFLVDQGATKFLAFAAIYVFINTHHFAVDGLIWKLREPALQKLLIA